MAQIEELSPNNMQFSDFVQQKIRVWFRILDTSKDGFMAKDDYEIIAQRFAAQYNLSESQGQEIYEWLVNGFKITDKRHTGEVMPMVKQMAETIKNGGKLSEDEYVGALGQLMLADPVLAKDCLKYMVTLFFEIFDYDEDGFISCAELEKGLCCFGYDDKEAIKEIFKNAEGDYVDRMSRDEYVNMWLDFIFGDNKNNPLIALFAPHLL